jgi:ABC-2 type transport system permease protein
VTDLRAAVRDVVVMTTRNLTHIAREPLRLSDVTVQPVLFTLLFVYVLGAGLVLPDHGSSAAAIHAWPLQHAVLASVIWSVALLAVFAPLATRLYRTRTAD